MEDCPLVTIITPCYNGEPFLAGYFESILSQTYPNLELIFVNDGSSDGTKRIALSYRPMLEQRGIRYIYLKQDNGGQAKAMNTGLREMTGKYLVWPDSDDLLSPDSIEKRVRFLEENPHYGLVRSNGDFFDFDTKETLYRISNLENRFHTDIFLDLILEESYCCCGCYMIRSKILREIYPNLTIYESSAGQNWQILIPITGRYLCGYIDEDLYHIALRKGSHSRQNRSLEQTVARYLELKKVLLLGIQLSGRRDRDYPHLVDVKYQKILFRIYMKAGDYAHGKEYYDKLKSAGEVEDWMQRIYLETLHPFQYRIYQFLDLSKRVLRKVNRLIQGLFRRKE